MKKITAIALTLFLIFINSKVIARDTYVENKYPCEKSHGVWREFGNECANFCSDKIGNVICSTNIIIACDCGKKGCFDEEENKCQDIESYKNKLKDEKDKKLAEEKKAKELKDEEAKKAAEGKTTQDKIGTDKKIPDTKKAEDSQQSKIDESKKKLEEAMKLQDQKQDKPDDNKKNDEPKKSDNDAQKNNIKTNDLNALQPPSNQTNSLPPALPNFNNLNKK